MQQKGRPRLSEDDLKARVSAYCKSYGASLTDQGLPEFPSGKRETPQHREWISLYKLWNRLGRRKRGQCERCQEPAMDGSVFCEEHRASAAGQHRASLDERKELLEAQKGLCPICAQKVDLPESVEHGTVDGRVQALLHASCNRLAGLAQAVGPEGIDRLRAYVWPRASKTRK
jgi:hypothetical protein